MQFALTLCLFHAAAAHFDYKPFLEPHVKTPLYGRYAGMTPSTDPRLDKTYAATWLAVGLGNLAPPLTCPADYEGAKETMAAVMTGGFDLLFGALLAKAPKYDVNRRDIEIDGVDGNKIPLSIYQGTSKTCYYNTHGGGMAVLSSRHEPFLSSYNQLNGKHGITIVAVDYRTFLHHPDEDIKVAQYPAGLNDSYSGLEWLYKHKEELGCETVVNFGESGGGNICLTLALKTLKEGRPELLDGSFCMCPTALYDMFSHRTPSMSENSGYYLDLRNQGSQNMMDLFTADLNDQKDPLAWAINAGPEDMKGMKPVMIIINELDPVRDAGLEMYRNLLAGGVQAEARMVAGTLHAGDIFATGPMYIFDSSANAMKSFAAGLRGKILIEADAPPQIAEVV